MEKNPVAQFSCMEKRLNFCYFFIPMESGETARQAFLH